MLVGSGRCLKDSRSLGIKTTVYPEFPNSFLKLNSGFVILIKVETECVVVGEPRRRTHGRPDATRPPRGRWRHNTLPR